MSGATLSARNGAVGAIKEALLAGAPCDLMIATDKLIDSGALLAAGCTPIDCVPPRASISPTSCACSAPRSTGWAIAHLY